MSTRLASWSQPADPRRAVVAATSRWRCSPERGSCCTPASTTATRSSTRPSTRTTATRSPTGRCPTATSASSTRRGRCRCSHSRRCCGPRTATSTATARFEAEMLVCGGLAVLFVLRRSCRWARARSGWGSALGFTAVAPLLIGSVMLSRFDLWPAALTVGVLAALLAGKDRLAAGVLGVAVAAKIYPVVALPLLAIWVGAGGAPRCPDRARDLRRPWSLPASYRSSSSRPTACGTASPARPNGPSRSSRSAPCCSSRTRSPGWGSRWTRATARRTSSGGARTRSRGSRASLQPRRRRGLGLVRPGADGARPPGTRLRRRGLRVHRVRQGLLAPVPDLAIPLVPLVRGRRGRGERVLGAGARPHPDVVPVPTTGTS